MAKAKLVRGSVTCGDTTADMTGLDTLKDAVGITIAEESPHPAEASSAGPTVVAGSTPRKQARLTAAAPAVSPGGSADAGSPDIRGKKNERTKAGVYDLGLERK